MDFRLTDGVELHIIKTSQFKNNQIIVNFGTPQTADNTTARSLLGDLLETSTHKYPTQTALARQLSRLYGADVGTGVARIGTMHTVRLKARFINDQYAFDGLLDRTIDLIHEMLFNPLIDNGSFDEPTFNLQKANLYSAIKSLDDDKQYYAATKLRQLYFDKNSVMQIPSFGRLDDLESLTAEKLVEVYHNMVSHDKINIVVLGDVDENHVIDQFKQFEFAPRHFDNDKLMYRQEPKDEAVTEEETQALNQSKLNLAYELPVYFLDKDHYAAVVMNGILGGSPLSKLFVNVREKESLAYYASSQYHSFSGMLSIQTGIQNVNYDRARTLIKEQIDDIIAGKFSDELMREVKEGLVNQYKTSLDTAGNIVERKLTDSLLHQEPDDVVEKVNQVTSADVVRVASKLKLQAVYYLNGDLKNE